MKQNIVIPVELAFSLLDSTRLAHVWMLRDQDDKDGKPELGEDFKPHKWPDDARLEAAQETVDVHRKLLRLMEEQTEENMVPDVIIGLTDPPTRIAGFYGVCAVDNASEYIGTLPEYEDGRYYIDDMKIPEEG